MQHSQLCLWDLCFLCFFFFLSSLSAEWWRRCLLDLHSLLLLLLWLLLSLSDSFLSLFLFFFVFFSWGTKTTRGEHLSCGGERKVNNDSAGACQKVERSFSSSKPKISAQDQTVLQGRGKESWSRAKIKEPFKKSISIFFSPSFSCVFYLSLAAV